MVGEQLKMWSYVDYALAVGLHDADATGTVCVEPFKPACVQLSMQLDLL